MAPLPAWANSGQYSATLASKASMPRDTATANVNAVMPFVVENMLTMVSGCQVVLATPSR